MRRLICAVIISLVAPGAFAADLDEPDVLRGTLPVGPATFTRWSGFYAGGHFSYSDAGADFSKATEPLISNSLVETLLQADAMPSTWPALGTSHTNMSGFGGFAGYNTQWQDLILGLEVNYTHSPVTITNAGAPILGRVTTAGSYTYSVNVEGSGALTITDYGSLRARAGWILGNFLPYGFIGVALGRGNYAVTSLVYGQQNVSSATPPVVPCDPTTEATCFDYSFANSNAKNGALLYGVSAGAGVDVALTTNVFVRGEYEFIEFAPVANITANISSVRVGAGLKF